jgi:putative membrane-bound dehydrogenase-like protein
MHCDSRFIRRIPACLLLFCALSLASLSAVEITPPRTLDPELQITLFASEPEIVTPIGIAADGQDRIFVVESHTHEVKPDYPGPKYDRVKIFQDTEGDGKPDKISIFAGDLHHAMNIVFSPKNELYLVQRDGVFILRDKDGDDVSESRSTVLTLETDGKYPHNGLDGIAFSPDEWLYVGLGENLGRKYTLKGSDGSEHSGGGEGGNIFRCKPDGSKLQLFATGFWNPFALEFDHNGRLFAVDNDPDGRPPCRLLHIVEGGDYGYKFRYGRSGLHRFVAWDGELPGTLPMMAGTGEAPSGILECDKAALPRAYQGNLLVTAWGENTIERYRLKRAGASMRAEREIVLQGDKSFWPVGIVATPTGTVYITDWADREYSVHGKGRIWRLAGKSGVATRTPRGLAVTPENSSSERRMNRLVSTSATADYDELIRALIDPDPFIRSAAVSSLAKPLFRSRVEKAMDHENPEIRLGALLALRRAKLEDPVSILRKCLADPDEQIRRMALLWTGENGLTALAKDIERALSAGSLTPTIFSTYLAAEELLAGDPETTQVNSKNIWAAGATASELIERIISDDSKPANLRAMALAMSAPPNNETNINQLARLLNATDMQLRLEAVRTLGESTNASSVSTLKMVALNRGNPPEQRAEAVLALARQPIEVLWEILDFLGDTQVSVQVEGARALRAVATDGLVQGVLLKTYQSRHETKLDPAVVEQLEMALRTTSATGNQQPPIAGRRPSSDAEWRAALEKAGDAKAGRRVFFHPLVACAKCHRVQGRGGQAGPDLSVIGRAATKEKLIQSILHPSQDIGPLYLTHRIETRDGQSYDGLISGRGADGLVTLITADAKTVMIPGDKTLSDQTGKVSLMPEGLENSLTTQDFRDMLAFLLSLK